MFNTSGTSKFSGAREVLGKNGKEVLLRKTLAYDTHHGIGFFCLTEAGESPIGWVPEKDEANLNAIENALHLPNFRAKINRASAKKLGEKFTKIAIRHVVSKTGVCVHDRNTRYKINLNIPAFKSASGQRTFLYRAMSFWNSLPREIRECDNLPIFKRHLKEFLSSF